MSLKRKCDFDQIQTSICPEDESIESSAPTMPTTKFIKTDQLLHRTSPSNNSLHSNNFSTNDHHERKSSTGEQRSFLFCVGSGEY